MTPAQNNRMDIEAECRNLHEGEEIKGVRQRMADAGINLSSVKLIAEVYDCEVVKDGKDLKITKLVY